MVGYKKQHSFLTRFKRWWVKRWWVFAALLICGGFCFAACEYSYYLYYNTDGVDYFLKKGVESIELIRYENPAVQNAPLEKFEFDLERLEILAVLEINETTQFLKKLSKIGGLGGYRKTVLASPIGLGKRIVYDDGSFSLVTVTIINGVDCIFYGEYDAEKNLSRNFGIAEQGIIDNFKALIDEYFGEQNWIT